MPVQGQLVPMAIPLGAPRQIDGSIPGQVIIDTQTQITTSTPVDHSVKPHPDGVTIQQPKTPESKIHKATSNLTVQEEDFESTEESIAENSERSEPIALPGYHHPTPAKYHGPSFPPQRRENEDQPVLHELAANLASRDVVENKAREWIEQELMAKILSEMAKNKTEAPAVTYATVPRVIEKPPDTSQSETSVSGNESLIAEAVGQDGLQLFVDAGVRLDEALVSDLIKQVLLEKTSNMLAERQQPLDPVKAAVPVATPRPISPAKHVTPKPLEQEYSPIVTPVPTPPASPVFKKEEPVQIPAAKTPDISPEVSVKELNAGPHVAVYVEQSTDEDVTLPSMVSDKDNVAEVGGSSPVFVSQHDVITPEPTPPPAPLHATTTPDTSIKDQPITIPQKPAPLVDEEKSITSSSDESLHPWGDPNSPVSENQPDYQDAMTQYQIGSLADEEPDSLAAGPNSIGVQAQPESPVIQEKKISPVSSLQSSISDTAMENISDGQWLVSGISEGEIRPFIATGNNLNINKMGHSEAEDTLYEADDIEQDFDPISEGEFLHKTPSRGHQLPISNTEQSLQLIEKMIRQQKMIPVPKSILKGNSNEKLSADRDVSKGELSKGEIVVVNEAKQAPDSTYSAEKIVPVASPRKHSTDSKMLGETSTVPNKDKRRGSFMSGPIMATDTPTKSKRHGLRGDGRMSVSRSFSPPPPSNELFNIYNAPQKTSSEFDFKDTLGQGTRTMTPDQINMEALIQSREYLKSGTYSDFMSTVGSQPSINESAEYIARMQGLTLNESADTLSRFERYDGARSVKQSSDWTLDQSSTAKRLETHYRTLEGDLQTSGSQSLHPSDYMMNQTDNSDTSQRLAQQYRSTDFGDGSTQFGQTNESIELRGSINYPDSLEGTSNFAQTYAQTLEASESLSEADDIAHPQITVPRALSVTIPSMEQADTGDENSSDVSQVSPGNYSPSRR